MRQPFEVWQKQGHGERFFEDENLQWPDPRFKLVATMSLAAQTHLEDLWRITQHIESNWTEEAYVTVKTDDPIRSTCVGDVIVDAGGKPHQIMTCGFQEVPAKYPKDYTQFDAFECHPISVIDSEGTEEQSGFPETADYWAVFGHLPSGGTECLFDVTTREMAEAAVDGLESLIKKEVPA